MVPAVLGNDSFVAGFLLSLQVALIATLIGLALGVPAAVCLVRGRFAGREAVNTLLLLPLIVPGIVLGTAIYVFQIETEIATGLPILGSTRRARRRPHALIVDPLDGAPGHREPGRLRSAPSRRRRKNLGANAVDDLLARDPAGHPARASSPARCSASSSRSAISR